MTAKSLTHAFQSAVADGTDATLVRPSNWNADHVFWLGYRAVTTGTDAIAQTDHLSLISYNNAGGVAVSLPAPAAGNFGLGWKVKLRNNAAGAVTITPASTINGSATAISLAANESIEIFGTGTTDFAGVLTRAPVAPVGGVRYDISQSLSTPQQAVALQNIGAAQNNLINGKLVASVAANAATFAIKTLAGADPSATDPVGVMFPDASLLWITAALSLTVPSGATLGTYAGWPFRLWFAVINNAGTPVLSVRNCSCIATNQFSVSGMSPGITGMTSPPGNNYKTTYGAVTIATSQPYRYIAYADYDSGQVTAGTWIALPSRIIHMSPNSPLPGAAVQEVFASMAAQVNVTPTAVFTNTNITAAIAPFFVTNLVRIQVNTGCGLISTVANASSSFRLLRVQASVVIGGPMTKTVTSYASSSVTDQVSFDLMDILVPLSTMSYVLQVTSTNGTLWVPYNAGDYNAIRLTELMG
jgi:hypothetical protein